MRPYEKTFSLVRVFEAHEPLNRYLLVLLHASMQLAECEFAYFGYLAESEFAYCI
jgi:hypothetical protein